MPTEWTAGRERPREVVDAIAVELGGRILLGSRISDAQVIRLSEAPSTSRLALVLADLWPTFALRIHTPRLTLRLPEEHELADLAQVVAEGVHKPDERPFLTPWTECPPEERARNLLQGYWDDLASWSPDSWTLGLAVFVSDGTPIGMVSLRARDFRVTRGVTTTSWLGLPHHHQGFGTEARAGLLTLAFDHLGATDATTEVFTDNDASQGVSRRLGYQHDGISKDARGDEVLVSDRLRLTAERWAEIDHPPVTVEGVEQARSMFLGWTS
jgi:RimJ/RimL family protein N-acetyltransferase